MKCYIDNFSKAELEEIVKDSFTYSEVCRKMGYKSVKGEATKAIRRRLEEFGISTVHFHSVVHRVKRTKENVFTIDSSASQRTLRDFYLKEGYTPEKCDICGIKPVWNNNPLTMILDHKNGINNDNRLDNLHWICPNCNSQLSTTGYTGERKHNITAYLSQQRKIC